MFRHPTPDHYFNSLGAKIKPRGARGKAQPPRHKSGPGRHVPRYATGKKNKGHRGRRGGMNEEAQPSYAVGPDGRLYLASGVGYHPLQQQQQQQQQQQGRALAGQAQRLNQWVKTPDEELLYVTKRGKVQRAVKDPSAKMLADKRIHNGPTIHNNRVWITKGRKIHEATVEDLANVVKHKKSNVKQERKDNTRALIKKKGAPHETYDKIRQALPELVKGSNNKSNAVFESFKDKPVVGEIFDGAAEFAKNLMNREGFFSNRKENYRVQYTLKYAYHHGLAGFEDSDKIPAFIVNFDKAWNNGEGEMSDRDRFKATLAYMKVLAKNMAGAILSTLNQIEKKSEEARMAHTIAKMGDITDTGDAKINAKEVAMKIFSNEKDVKMKNDDKSDLVIKEVCKMIVEQVDGKKLSLNKIWDYCVTSGKLNLFHFVCAHTDAFEKKARNTEKHSEGGQFEPLAPPTVAEAHLVSSSAGRALGLVSMRN